MTGFVYKSFEEDFRALAVQMETDLLTAIGGGQAKDFPTYQNVCGQLRGQKNLFVVFEQLLEKYNRE